MTHTVLITQTGDGMYRAVWKADEQFVAHATTVGGALQQLGKMVPDDVDTVPRFVNDSVFDYSE